MKTTTVQISANIRDGLKQLVKDNDDGSNISSELNKIVHNYIMQSGSYIQASNGYAKKGDTLLLTNPATGIVEESTIRHIVYNIVTFENPSSFSDTLDLKVNQITIKR